MTLEKPEAVAQAMGAAARGNYRMVVTQADNTGAVVSGEGGS